VDLSAPCRVAAIELRTEEPRHEVVEAVPLTAIVERDHQEVLLADPFDQVGRAGAVQQVVAEAAGDAVEARRVEQEGSDVGLEIIEQLLAEVVDEVAMVAGEVAEERRHRAATDAVGERREVQGHRPSLGPIQHLRQLVRGDVDPERREQPLGLARVERQVSRPDLDQPAPHAHPASRQRDLVAAAEDEARASREVVDEHPHGVEHLVPDELVHVVEHERERLRAVGEHRAELRQRGRADRRRAGPEGRDAFGIDRIDVVDRQGHAGQQGGGFVLGRRQRDPRRRPGIDRRQLGDERRLAVARRRGHGDDLAVASLDALHHRRAGDEPGRRPVQLRGDRNRCDVAQLVAHRAAQDSLGLHHERERC
jgi:hypothetical protein